MHVFLTGLAFLSVAGRHPAFAQVDQTKSAGAGGQEVVDAVVELIQHSCVFEDDRFFLRRLAFVESGDGLNGNTYRFGYNGGIWQVDEDKFNETQSSTYARRYFVPLRQSSLKIDWTHAQWSDLRKPLYSGVAARLYMEVMTRGLSVPRGISEQAVIWHRDYHDSNPAPTSNFTLTANLLSQTCTGDRAIDVVFILDTSGSVDIADFEKAKEFVIRLIPGFTYGPSAVQVAVVKFSTTVNVEFYLKEYTTSTSLISRVRRIRYYPGFTDTATAIDLAVNEVLSERNGGRRNVPKAAILITDGQSDDHLATVQAAARARSKGVTLYAVGVGSNIVQSELRDIASDPDCTHVFLVKDFSMIEALKEQMQEATCKTLIQVAKTSVNESNSNATDTGGVICELGKECSPIAAKTPNTTGNNTEEVLVTTVNCGSATVYAAYNIPNPGAAYYEIKAVATEKKPAVIFLDHAGETLYVTVRGQHFEVMVNETTNTTITCKAVTEIRDKTDIITTTPDGHVDVQCVQRGDTRKCKAADLISFKEELCQVPWDFPNPCTRQNLLDHLVYFPHPHHLDRYLRCDLAGNVYIVQCPKGYMYNQITRTCGTGGGNPGNRTGDRTLLPTDETNPCTVQSILTGHMLFPYIPDNTMFISCDVWGKAWLHHCNEDFIWDPKDLRCVVKSASVHVQGPGPLEPDVPNPCTKEHIAARLFFWPYPPASDRYIQCDLWGDAYVMMCFSGGHWSVVAVACVAAG